MNKARRKELQKALDLLYEAKDIVEQCRDGEQDAFYNLPEGLQSSERGEQMEGYISLMDEAYDNIDFAESNIGEML